MNPLETRIRTAIQSHLANGGKLGQRLRAEFNPEDQEE